MLEPEAIDSGHSHSERSRGTAVRLASAAVVVVAVLVAGWLVIRPGSRAQQASTGPTITAFGTLALFDPVAGFDRIHDGVVRVCEGSGANADVRPGAEITVKAGSIVRTGRVVGGLAYGDTCRFTWAVTKVPSGFGRYQISVPDRGMIEVAEADLANEIWVYINAPSRDLTTTPPPGAGSGQLPFAGQVVVGTLVLIDEAGPFATGSPCRGTGLNADIGPATAVVLSQDGVRLANSGLVAGIGSDASECRFAFFAGSERLMPQRPFTLSIAGHGSVEIQPELVGFGLVAIIVLDESGRLTA
jgi:hypothetical protein